MGALGFEPRSAGIFRLACTWQVHALGLRRVGAPVGHQNHQKNHSSSFPCNWSPRYYQVILYPQGWATERTPSYDALGRVPQRRGGSQSDDTMGPTTMLVRTHNPKTTEANPQALGRIPTLRRPRILDSEPGRSAIVRTMRTAEPAQTANPTSKMGAVPIPTIPELATAPTPCGTMEGTRSQRSQASHKPR